MRKMKKLLYIMVFALTTSVSVTACVEEEITPKESYPSTGVSGSEDPF